MTIHTTENPKDAADFLAVKIISELEKGQRVLWFVTGGSSIAVAIEAAKTIVTHPHQNLVVMLTDERYGPLDHPESNWHGLMSGGFSLPQATLIPILTGDTREITVEKFSAALKEQFPKAQYKIGLFGMGADGHTGGVLPQSIAALSEDWSIGYDTEKFERITVTPPTIEKFDEIVAYAVGQEKWKIIESLEKEIVSISDEPVQVLKRVPLFTLFTNYMPQK